MRNLINEVNSKSKSYVTRFQVSRAVKIHVEVFWVVTPCSAVVG
jgi:hypothetical protein